jgi:hypothetical protein
VYCLGVLNNWREGEDPFWKHLRCFPSCPFIRCMPVGNIPLSPTTGEEVPADNPLACQINLFNLRHVAGQSGASSLTGPAG